MMESFFNAFLVSLIAAAISAPLVLKLLVSLKSRQTISTHAPEGHQKKQGTPTMGGIIVLIAIFAGMLCSIRIPNAANLLPYAVLLLGFALIGFVDDYVVPKLMEGKRGLGWKQKLILQIILVGVAMLFAPTGISNTPQFNLNQFSAMSFGWVLLSVLFMSNAYNFSDGLDGLAASLGILMSVGFAFLGHHWGTPDVTIVSLSMIAGFLVFLFFNAPPALVFMGDIGALPFGAVFGWMLWRLAGLSPDQNWPWEMLRFWPLFLLIFLMFVELVPVPLQIFWVKVFKKKLFIYTPIHHAFEKIGWPETRVVWRFVVVQAVLTSVTILWVLSRGIA